MRKTKESSSLSIIMLSSRKKLGEKYSFNDKHYRMKIIDEILFNENTHCVSKFKDYLIYDDNNEFLNKYFEIKEIEVVLYLILEYFINYSKINPSFILNKEGKILYKNFQRKQKLHQSKHIIKNEAKNLKIGISDFLLSENINSSTQKNNKPIEVFKKSIIENTNINNER